VRQIMEYYLAVRMRRLGRAYLGGEAARPAQSPYLRGTPSAGSPIGAGVGIATQTRVSQSGPALWPPSSREPDRAGMASLPDRSGRFALRRQSGATRFPR
jgi:hypothetical protein